MIVGLCWIVGCYGLAVLLVHAMLGSRLRHAASHSPIHVILLTYNNQLQIEWYLRYLSYVSWWQGKLVQVTLTDSGSTDETLAIAERFAEQLVIRLVTEQDLSEQVLREFEQHAVVVSLRDRRDLVEVPLTP